MITWFLFEVAVIFRFVFPENYMVSTISRKENNLMSYKTYANFWKFLTKYLCFIWFSSLNALKPPTETLFRLVTQSSLPHVGEWSNWMSWIFSVGSHLASEQSSLFLGIFQGNFPTPITLVSKFPEFLVKSPIGAILGEVQRSPWG